MYQTVQKRDILAYLEGRQTGSLGAHDIKVTYAGTNGPDWVDDVNYALEEVLEDWHGRDLEQYKSDQVRDELEGELAAILHKGLAHLPAEVLTDRDFWRYCAAYMYDFVLWRQPGTTLASLFPYFGAAANTIGRDCVPHRMFDRAHIAKTGGDAAGDGDPYALARFGASDVWKSHILRVANGNAPIVVREILLDVKGGKLKTDVIRPFVKNLRRVRANVLFEVLDEPQARELIDRETQRTLAKAALDVGHQED